MKKLFYNGTILTLEAPLYAQAVLTEDDKILQVGTLADLTLSAPHAQRVDLAGHTLLPAFLDPHGHFSSYANAQLQVSLEGAASWAEIARRVEAFLADRAVAPGAWVVAAGYDHNALAEGRHPDRGFLDRLAPKNPLLLQHQSGHCGVLNAQALAALGITADTVPPAGGAIGVADGALTGYLEEGAYIAAVKQVPMGDFPALLDAYRVAQQKYLAQGITTVQEGMMVAQMLPLYRALLESGLLTLDLVGYPDLASMAPLEEAFPQSRRDYHRHFKIGGYKIILDGSPQVKTAWMRTPYRDGTLGYGTMEDGAVLAAVAQAGAQHRQILAHCNGDRAAEQFLTALGLSARQHPDQTPFRPVMIHAQLLGRDQLPEVARLGVIPSFFVAHVLHWGDIHVENFGPARAGAISPAASALRLGIPFTFHQDAPVIEPDMLETISCAVTRKTRSGMVLGGEEGISPLEALRAVTQNAAYQYGEEDTKGTLKAGKLANFVVLDRNPLAVPPEEISDIHVVETIQNGGTVFCRSPQNVLFS